MNMRFEYLYRDSGNFKNWGEIIFSNPNKMSIDELVPMAGKVLIDQSYFYATKAKVPDLHFEEYNEQLDHGWHEFHAFQVTDDIPNDPYKRSVDEFIESLRYNSG
jgi:hypothetical protein